MQSERIDERPRTADGGGKEFDRFEVVKLPPCEVVATPFDYPEDRFPAAAMGVFRIRQRNGLGQSSGG